MMSAIRAACISIIDALYAIFARYLLFRLSAQRGHDLARRSLRALGAMPGSSWIAELCHRLFFPRQRVSVGGVVLNQRLILAAGFLKSGGLGGAVLGDEATTEQRGGVPAWRFVPALVGPVEFGSFTRYARAGNAGTVVWRREGTHSTQNRIGLRNMGAEAAARALSQLIASKALKREFGVNIAPTPGLTDLDELKDDVAGSLDCFLKAGVRPDWFTLNVSCPNTEDDPLQQQVKAQVRELGGVCIERLRQGPGGREIPLWIKISPDLPRERYADIMSAADEVGIRAIVATNTLPQPSPDDGGLPAGVGGGELFDAAVEAVRQLLIARKRGGYDVDVIACGGVITGESLLRYEELGVKAAQYWSALVYRGPFAAAIIERENARLKKRFSHQKVHRERLA